jgi:hypothetical protein
MKVSGTVAFILRSKVSTWVILNPVCQVINSYPWLIYANRTPSRTVSELKVGNKLDTSKELSFKTSKLDSKVSTVLGRLAKTSQLGGLEVANDAYAAILERLEASVP